MIQLDEDGYHPFTGLTGAVEAAGLYASAYSGRGQYGKRCVAVRSDERPEAVVWKVAAAFAGLHPEHAGGQERFDGDGSDLFLDVQVDNLGLGWVVYWPQVEWDDEAADVYGVALADDE